MVNCLCLDRTPRRVSDCSMSIDISMYGKLLQSAGLVVSQACQVHFVCLVQLVVYNHTASQSSFSVSDVVVCVVSSTCVVLLVIGMRHRLVSEFCIFFSVIASCVNFVTRLLAVGILFM